MSEHEAIRRTLIAAASWVVTFSGVVYNINAFAGGQLRRG
jgi:hypothetical protein